MGIFWPISATFTGAHHDYDAYLYDQAPSKSSKKDAPIKKRKPPIGICTNNRCHRGTPIKITQSPHIWKTDIYKWVTNNKSRLQCKCGTYLYWSSDYKMKDDDKSKDDLVC